MPIGLDGDPRGAEGKEALADSWKVRMSPEQREEMEQKIKSGLLDDFDIKREIQAKQR